MIILLTKTAFSLGAAKCTANRDMVGKHLSENAMLHVYGETSGEFFSNMIRDIADELEYEGGTASLEKLRLQYFTHAKVKGHAQTDIMGNTMLVEMFVNVWKLNSYYNRTKLFQPNWMKRNAIGRVGAVIRNILSSMIILILIFVSCWHGRSTTVWSYWARSRLQAHFRHWPTSTRFSENGIASSLSLAIAINGRSFDGRGMDSTRC